MKNTLWTQHRVKWWTLLSTLRVLPWFLTCRISRASFLLLYANRLEENPKSKTSSWLREIPPLRWRKGSLPLVWRSKGIRLLAWRRRILPPLWRRDTLRQHWRRNIRRWRKDILPPLWRRRNQFLRHSRDLLLTGVRDRLGARRARDRRDERMDGQTRGRSVGRRTILLKLRLLFPHSNVPLAQSPNVHLGLYWRKSTPPEKILLLAGKEELDWK